MFVCLYIYLCAQQKFMSTNYIQSTIVDINVIKHGLYSKQDYIPLPNVFFHKQVSYMKHLNFPFLRLLIDYFFRTLMLQRSNINTEATFLQHVRDYDGPPPKFCDSLNIEPLNKMNRKMVLQAFMKLYEEMVLFGDVR